MKQKNKKIIIEFSKSSSLTRIIGFVMGISPLCLYFFLKMIFSWDLNLNIGFLVLIIIWLLYFILIFGFACNDWNFYIGAESFLFKRRKKQINVSFDVPFKIKHVFIGTAYFQILKISFKDNRSFYFRYKPIRTKDILFSPEKSSKEIEKEISKTIVEQKGKQ